MKSRKTKSHVIVTAFAALVMTLLGQAARPAETWAVGKLEMVYPLADGDVVLIMTPSPPGCTASGSQKYLYLRPGENGMTKDGSRQIYAAALMALTTQATVQLVFDDATAYCTINRLRVLKE